MGMLYRYFQALKRLKLLVYLHEVFESRAVIVPIAEVALAPIVGCRERLDVGIRYHQAEEEVQEVGHHYATEEDQRHTNHDDDCMPDEAFQVCGRQGEFADTPLLCEQVVEHVACRDNRVGEANQTDSHGETLHIVRGVAHEQEALREHVVEVEEHDGCADERHHHDGRTRIELAVDTEVPASHVYKSFETKTFHLKKKFKINKFKINSAVQLF